ncbi:MAG: 2-oxo acid dehydrogenase subunit E2 [Thermoplasmata archaeon]|nr:MAG: 2-oxo acid dehydrogenase subunit E2 [Thermoplasmata archaeon]
MSSNQEIKVLLEQYDLNIKDIKGTGPGGEVTVEDVERYIKEKYFPKVKREVRVVGIRKIISERLSKSYREAVHVTVNMEVFMDNLSKLRENISSEYSMKIPYTVLLLKLISMTLSEFPDVNSALENGKIVEYGSVNINIAVDSPIGLVTPVIRDVNLKGLKELIKDYEDVISRAKEAKLKQVDFVGGTFTITNLGMFGVDYFNPIINPPQAAILGINRIVEKPRVLDNEIKIVKTMNLSLTFDHRIIDGAEASRFLLKLKSYIEKPEEIINIKEVK